MSDLQASQKVMKHYLNALLTEDVVETPIQQAKKQQLNELLAPVSAPVVAPVKAPVIAKPAVVAPVTAPVVKAPVVAPVAPVVEQVKVAPVAPAVKAAAPVVKDYRKGRFQALFFTVAGLKVALPLKALGGIHKMMPISSLPGQPEWLKGVMLYREQKINVVDTALWVMPEKYDQGLAEKLNYQYVIMLGNSHWGLACDTLVNTIALEQDEVKWRETEGKRPWLAGLIKQHMCALLDVDALIALLAKGMNSQH
ncbi:MAG: chemotaxis protein CheW [Gammaproteobacteria bacterium]|nr:chemotaxis protein CheW [Gammaproteobacteria bacterium]MBU2058433.1 chemotaxis protein CheW [Gammaproteobacteria bacterium]MBU2176514.1 chemotaxis protein CheW [Gammaproteobacteria bacterium]MBU2248544.1 chemotaxis protein CheW [Gammaproteobacteria bacterium]MBU2345593.1 chemotaxis protein CheW [Gammaproteobacteria bacterium]